MEQSRRQIATQCTDKAANDKRQLLWSRAEGSDKQKAIATRQNISQTAKLITERTSGKRPRCVLTEYEANSQAKFTDRT